METFSTDPKDPPTAPATEPNDLGYTAKDIAEHLGISDTTLRTKWWPKLLKAFNGILPETDLKTPGKFGKYTPVAFQQFEQYQRHCSTKLPVRNDDGDILQMEPNTEYKGYAAYCDHVLAQFGSLRTDPTTEPPNGSLTILDAEILETERANMDTAETFGDDIGSALDDFVADMGAMDDYSLGAALAQRRVDRIAQGYNDTFRDGLQQLATTGKAASKSSQQAAKRTAQQV